MTNRDAGKTCNKQPAGHLRNNHQNNQQIFTHNAGQVGGLSDTRIKNNQQNNQQTTSKTTNKQPTNNHYTRM
jgi:hypothetical protein